MTKAKMYRQIFPMIFDNAQWCYKVEDERQRFCARHGISREQLETMTGFYWNFTWSEFRRYYENDTISFARYQAKRERGMVPA